MRKCTHHTRVNVHAVGWRVHVMMRRWRWWWCVTSLRSPRWCVGWVVRLMVPLAGVRYSFAATFKAHRLGTAEASVIVPAFERLVSRFKVSLMHKVRMVGVVHGRWTKHDVMFGRHGRIQRM